MQIESIPFSNTKSFSKLFLDHQNASVTLRDFVSVFPSVDDISGLASQCKHDESDRQKLVNVLRDQYKRAGINDSRINELIEALLDRNTFTVTTGHQLQLAGGPLFFTFKILTTIRLAEELNKRSDKKFVPVFWLASEDHDIHEIDNLVLFDKEISWKKDLSGSPLSGQLQTKGLSGFFDEIDQLIAGSAFENEFRELVRGSYLSNAKDLSEATRLFVHNLFKDLPVLILDSNDSRLKQSFSDILHREVESSFSNDKVQATTKALEDLGYSGQASSREINLFYINNGNRERIDKDGRMFRTANGSKEWVLQSIKDEIEEHPERFSPNVILRPMYQQRILPNVAYIGGPAEVSYWLQLKDAFTEASIVFPALVSRNSAMVTDQKQVDKLSKIQVKIEDLFTEEEELVKSYVKQHAGDIELNEEKEEIAKVFSRVIDKAAKTDVTLKPAAEAELKKILNGLDAFQAKILRAEKHKQEQTVSQIRKAKQKLFPGGSLQERQETIIPFYIKYGPGFIKQLYDAMEPVPTSFKVLIPEG